MTRPLAGSAAALFAILALAACGSDGDATTAGTEPGSVAPGSNPGADEPLGGGIGAIGTIDVEITRPDNDPVRYTIGCMGDTFPVTPEVDGIDGAAACAQLGQPEVQERLTEGAPTGQACTEIYGGPDVATITGELDGEAIDTTVDRADGCGIADWDDLLSDVLPPSPGATG